MQPRTCGVQAKGLVGGGGHDVAVLERRRVLSWMRETLTLNPLAAKRALNHMQSQYESCVTIVFASHAPCINKEHCSSRPGISCRNEAGDVSNIGHQDRTHLSTGRSTCRGCRAQLTVACRRYV